MDVENIDAPVLIFGTRHDTVEFVRDKNMLSVTNRIGLKKGIMLGNVIVDSSGNVFKTISAVKKGNYYPFWKFEFFNPMIYIQREVEKAQEKSDLEELKVKIIKIIKREENDWTNYGSVEKIIKSIHETRSHRELINVIGDYVYPIEAAIND